MTAPNWPAALAAAESEQSGDDPAAAEADRAEAAFDKLRDMIHDLAPALRYDITAAAAEYGMYREKHAIKIMTARLRPSRRVAR